MQKSLGLVAAKFIERGTLITTTVLVTNLKTEQQEEWGHVRQQAPLFSFPKVNHTQVTLQFQAELSRGQKAGSIEFAIKAGIKS